MSQRRHRFFYFESDSLTNSSSFQLVTYRRCILFRLIVLFICLVRCWVSSVCFMNNLSEGKIPLESRLMMQLYYCCSVEKRVSFQQKTVHVDNFNMKPCFVFPLHLGVCFQMNRRSLTCCVRLQSPAAAQISSDFCWNTETWPAQREVEEEEGGGGGGEDAYNLNKPTSVKQSVLDSLLDVVKHLISSTHSFHEVLCRTDEERLIYLHSPMMCFVWGLNVQLLSLEKVWKPILQRRLCLYVRNFAKQQSHTVNSCVDGRSPNTSHETTTVLSVPGLSLSTETQSVVLGCVWIHPAKEGKHTAVPLSGSEEKFFTPSCRSFCLFVCFFLKRSWFSEHLSHMTVFPDASAPTLSCRWRPVVFLVNSCVLFP